jgi:hypothetical protein
MVDGLIFCWFPTSTIRFSAETATAFSFSPQLPRTLLPTLAPDRRSFLNLVGAEHKAVKLVHLHHPIWVWQMMDAVVTRRIP